MCRVESAGNNDIGGESVYGRDDIDIIVNVAAVFFDHLFTETDVAEIQRRHYPLPVRLAQRTENDLKYHVGNFERGLKRGTRYGGSSFVTMATRRIDRFLLIDLNIRHRFTSKGQSQWSA